MIIRRPSRHPCIHPSKGLGLAHVIITSDLLGRCSIRSAPGEDKTEAEIVKFLVEWDAARIIHLIAECVRLGHHPTAWKSASGIVIPKQGSQTTERPA